MIRLIAADALATAVATSAQAMSPAPLHQPDGMTTQVAYGCGAGRTRVGGVCVARTTKRQVRRCAVWGTFAVDGTEFVACRSGAEIRRMSVFRHIARIAVT